MSLFSFNIKKAILFIGLFAISAASQAQNALLFNGSSSYVEIPYAATNNPAQFTVEFWARVDGGAGTFRAPLSSRQGGPPYNGYNFYANTGNTWDFTGGSGVWEGLSGPAVVIGQWTHLATTYDDFTIGYLHWTFLGVVTLSLFLLMDFYKLLYISRLGYVVYLTGFIMTEFLIFYKGLAGLLSLQIGDGYFLTLILGSLLIPVSILLILIANIKTKHSL